MPPTDPLELPAAPALPAFADNSTKTLTKHSRGFLQFVGASAASTATVQGFLLLQGLFHCKRIQVCVKPVFHQQMWSVLKRSLSRATRVFAELERATSRHINQSFLFLPKHDAASSGQGTSLFPVVVAAAAEQQLGLVLETSCALLRPQQPWGCS